MREMRNAYRILVGKPEEKRTHGRPRHRQKLGNWCSNTWTGFVWLKIGTSLLHTAYTIDACALISILLQFP
jgi:hypothetical protein